MINLSISQFTQIRSRKNFRSKSSRIKKLPDQISKSIVMKLPKQVSGLEKVQPEKSLTILICLRILPKVSPRFNLKKK
jgi:hypothetical protein